MAFDFIEFRKTEKGMDCIETIQEVYEKYGYNLEEKGAQYAVFSLSEAIYPGVDILVDDRAVYDEIRSKYADAEYSTNYVLFKDIESLDFDLYKRFLRPKQACRNLLYKYDEYVRKIVEPYEDEAGKCPEYKYINVGYQHECDFKNVTERESSIIDAIEKVIDQHGARLIIVEAPAGFGKTSTSMELLSQLCKKSNDIRPFLMELERDRQATTFRYLLLSQIDRTFEVKLKNDIVIDNIKKGRIPLIIDGFDELLSKDIDNGREIISVKKVETMLSTIAELLEGDSKVILTTRKTAIFAGEQFTDWYEYQRLECGRAFHVDRFQLHEADPEDWLEKGKLRQLPDTIRRISNPVLLSYLRYSDILDSGESINTKELVSKFFSSMYLRETKRQALHLSPEAQENILSNLAAYFCFFDITADTRTHVKENIREFNEGLINKSSYKEDDDELLNKLVNHAMLDRYQSGLIGFINDFVYGSLLTKAFTGNVEACGLIEEISMGNVHKIIESSDFLELDERKRIARALRNIKSISKEIKFLIDYRLLGEIGENYENLYLEDVMFREVCFCINGELKNSVFVQCRFENCFFDWSNVKDCQFISCDFGNSTFDGDHGSCDFYECENSPATVSVQSKENEDSDEMDLDSEILSKFFRAGSNDSRIRHISGIIRDLEARHSRKKIMKCLSGLKAKQYIYVDGDNAWIRQAGSDYLKNANING